MSTASPTLLRAVPVLPVPDLAAALACLCERMGFTRAFEYEGYAGVRRDAVELHVFHCETPPVAEWSSCRLYVSGIEALYAELQQQGVIHPNGALAERPWGLKEFTALLPGGAALVFGEASEA